MHVNYEYATKSLHFEAVSQGAAGADVLQFDLGFDSVLGSR